MTMEHRAAEIHDGLKHTVIDGDGHWMEPIPIFIEYLREVGGAGSVDQMRALWRGRDAWYRSTCMRDVPCQTCVICLTAFGCSLKCAAHGVYSSLFCRLFHSNASG